MLLIDPASVGERAFTASSARTCSAMGLPRQVITTAIPAHTSSRRLEHWVLASATVS